MLRDIAAQQHFSDSIQLEFNVNCFLCVAQEKCHIFSFRATAGIRCFGKAMLWQGEKWELQAYIFTNAKFSAVHPRRKIPAHGGLLCVESILSN
ncbi:MAG: hypothetical protein LBU76_02140 [Azoarcus sp.]|jgi:hypothetical protein|nr:hypothetical protein [Azoarcus sp.]